MKIVKFGGSSVADAAQISKIIDIVSADPTRRVVVVSAPGKRNSSDTKVTDLLITLAETVLAGNDFSSALDAVVERYAAIQKELDLDESITQEIRADLEKRIESRSSNTAQFMDTMKAAGEDNSAKLVAAAFVKKGIPARYVNPGEAGMLLSDEFGNAEVLPESFEKLVKLNDVAEIIIFPGFFGSTKSGEVATFPRGGSDITGAILAAALKAEVYENFTDVDSVYAMDPRVVPSAPALEGLTYREMRELSYAGFGVFHDEAIVPAVHAEIPICIKNTNRPEAPGTLITRRRTVKEGEVVAGIASSGGFCAIEIEKYMMNREIGFGRRLLQIFEEEGISYEHTPSGIDNLDVILRSSELDDGKKAHILERIQTELQPDSVEIEEDLVLVMLVGEGMLGALGNAGNVTKSLGDAGVNIEMINMGASEISIMLAVKEADHVKAIQALGNTFFAAS